ncbi:PCNA-associated factor isoform X1 [Piliocolobus tephrosceles]|uniref:PCNA-associated factor n=1 Tax=Macaca fascicularis TaxID=9541 RepID=A0A7N9CXI0_MACFA|nr:PREDICTED: PCNA-associated factor isoform X1 [Cercocebus atys]XP_023041080.1 PCNA-associated factor isoform X1 [Piliocolobus tephrosceles]XP_024652018.1 PCNA-associated factor isoform X1 [Macaca nemestrina]XP_028705968.1 PCNA-associated factor isoform X1 [Macaca mulatta]XP_045253234.1 PCNA-associated factor isoform X1 [Macaca fascicularis]
MVRTKADSVPGTYRKVVAARAPRKVLGSSTSATNSTPVSSRKAENKYAGGNPVCVRPTPKWQKGIGEFFRLSSKDSEKENQIPEEAGSSGLGKAKRNTPEATAAETTKPSNSALQPTASLLVVLLALLHLYH